MTWGLVVLADPRSLGTGPCWVGQAPPPPPGRPPEMVTRALFLLQQGLLEICRIWVRIRPVDPCPKIFKYLPEA